MAQDEATRRPLHVIVLSGGTSAEREVSLDSGRSVAEALRGRGHDVELFDPAERPLTAVTRAADILLPMLHGTGAEDGTLQESLDATGLPWVGSSAAASRLTFDKIETRHALAAAGLPVAPGAIVTRDTSATSIRDLSEFIGLPQVIKPARQGSSVGITIVSQTAQLDAAIREALRWGPRCLIERFIPGREVTVPVIDGRTFPTVEILPARAWYDYQAKYSDDATGYRIHPTGLPANLPELVARACAVCGVSAISRTDLRVDAEGRCWFLEINTIPGMTSHSLVPMSARALGLSLGELCEQVLRRRLSRKPVSDQDQRHPTAA